MSARLAHYGEWAVVTGASSGIGREVARELAAAGVKTVLVGRDAPALANLARSLPTESRTLTLDLSAPEAAQSLFQQCTTLDVGILVHAAGFGSGGAFLDTDPEHEAAMIDVNCRAVLTLTRLFATRFAERRRGAMVLFSSIVAHQGVPRAANYAATKAYIQALGEALALELKPAGIDILTVSPGPVASGFAERARMTMQNPDSAAHVARDIVAALGRKSFAVPGPRGKLLHAALMTAPRPLRTRIMQGIMRNMT